MVTHGYTIEFLKEPPPFQGIRWTRVNSEESQNILLKEITSLLSKDAIEVVSPNCSQEGFYSTLFLVPKKGGTLRPIINLRPLNAYVHVSKFKMETLRSVLRFVNPEDWLHCMKKLLYYNFTFT